MATILLADSSTTARLLVVRDLEEIAQIDIASVGAVTTTDREETIHQIANVRTFETQALSVHVYSKPIDSCVVYDLERRSCQRRPLTYYSKHGKVAASV